MSHSHSHGQLPKSAEAADARSFISAVSWSAVLRVTQVMSSQISAHHVSWKGISCPHPAEGPGLWQCLCRGNADPVAKHQHCKEVLAPLSMLVFWKRSVEKRWSTILNEHWALFSLDLDVMLVREQSRWAGSRICLLIFLLPISKYRGFGARFSIGTGIKTGISKHFPVITWVFISVLALWNRTKTISPLRGKIRTSHEVASIQEQLLTAYFPFLPWILRLPLAHPQQLKTVLAPVSATVLGQRNQGKTREHRQFRGVFVCTKISFPARKSICPLATLTPCTESFIVFLHWGLLKWKAVFLLTEILQHHLP